MVIVNIGEVRAVAKLLRISDATVLKKLRDPYLLTLEELIRLSGLMKVDLYTVIGIIIQNASFMYANSGDTEKYFKFLTEKVDRVKDLKATAYYPWALLDVKYKEDSILKIFNKETI